MLSLVAAPSPDAVRVYLQSLPHRPLLTAAEEVALSARARAGDQAAADELVERNLALCISIAQRYQGRGIALADLIQEGNLGLCKAALEYDGSRGFRFSTYATWWIRQAVTRAIQTQAHAIYRPVHMQERASKVGRVGSELTQALGRHPTAEEEARATGLTVEAVRATYDVPLDPLSLDQPIQSAYSEDSTCLADLVTDEGAPTVEDEAQTAELRDAVRRVVGTLPGRLRRVVVLRYGLDGRPPRTLEQVGQALGVTRERARQLETKAVDRLREARVARRLKGYAN